MCFIAAASPAARKGTLSKSGCTLIESAAISSAPSDLVDRLVADMTASWRQGERRFVESYLDQHPEVCGRPEEAIRLIYEEVCLRQDYGPEVARMSWPGASRSGPSSWPSC